MMRFVVGAILISIIVLTSDSQTPGVDSRGLALASSSVIIGVVQEPWQKVIRPDKVPKAGKLIPRADGTYIAELPRMALDYVAGYITHVRVEEVLKGDQLVRTNQVIQIFIPRNLEDGVSLPTKQRFLLVLNRFQPKKEFFADTFVIKVGEPVTTRGMPFDLRARYYSVAGDRNGAISITDQHQHLIDDIRSAIRGER